MQSPLLPRNVSLADRERIVHFPPEFAAAAPLLRIAYLQMSVAPRATVAGPALTIDVIQLALC